MTKTHNNVYNDIKNDYVRGDAGIINTVGSLSSPGQEGNVIHKRKEKDEHNY